nr:MAG TPA: hypothetical protein [Caudoviricetes sp.]
MSRYRKKDSIRARNTRARAGLPIWARLALVRFLLL